MAETNALDCPVGDWQNDSAQMPTVQAAALLGHLEEAHGDQMPQPVREGIQACKKELEKLPV